MSYIGARATATGPPCAIAYPSGAAVLAATQNGERDGQATLGNLKPVRRWSGRPRSAAGRAGPHLCEALQELLQLRCIAAAQVPVLTLHPDTIVRVSLTQ